MEIQRHNRFKYLPHSFIQDFISILGGVQENEIPAYLILKKFRIYKCKLFIQKSD